MTWLEVLVEGRSDEPVISEVLTRRFGLEKGKDFSVIPHTGRGSLPADPDQRADPRRTALLDQLPAKLRAYGLRPKPAPIVVVVVDTDDTSCVDLLGELQRMVGRLSHKPEVMFRLAIKELETWFLSDVNALRAAYPGKVRKAVLKNFVHDEEVNAWELLAKVLGEDGALAGEARKLDWARMISPHLNLNNPKSPSFQKFLAGVSRIVEAH